MIEEQEKNYSNLGRVLPDPWIDEEEFERGKRMAMIERGFQGETDE